MLTEKQLEAARLVGNHAGTVDQLARHLGISPRTLHNWKVLPEFRATAAKADQAWRGLAREHGIADPDRRLFRSNERWRAMQTIKRERARHLSMADIPGGKTGYILLKERSLAIGDGQYTTVIDCETDTALMAAERAEEVHAATHEGQWKKKLDLTLDGKVKTEAPPPLTVALAKIMTPDEISELRTRLKALEQKQAPREDTDRQADQ